MLTLLLFVYLSLESTNTKTTPIPNPERPIHHDHTALRHDDELNALLRWFSFIIHHQGGGIYVTGTSTVTMTECTIPDNTAYDDGGGAAAAGCFMMIVFGAGYGPKLNRCYVCDNLAYL